MPRFGNFVCVCYRYGREGGWHTAPPYRELRRTPKNLRDQHNKGQKFRGNFKELPRTSKTSKNFLETKK